MFRFLNLWTLTCLVVLLITTTTTTTQAQRPLVEECDSLICSNGGACFTIDSEEPECICPFNFTGPLCETPASCDRNCLNGGSCQFGDFSWLFEEEYLFKNFLERCTVAGLELEDCGVFRDAQVCQCPPNVYGSDCETTCDLQCQNNGTCELWRGSQTNLRCNCDYPYYGDLCEQTCDLPCQNGGRCLAFDINNDTIMEEMCLCPSNHTGDFCETKKPCSKPCENGGQCQQGDNWFLNEVEFFDEIFDRIFYECITYNRDGSDNGGDADLTDCFDLYAREYCVCPPDAVGEFCQISCDLECQNEGTCEVRGNEAGCRCQGGFFGELCEESCDLSCSNGGRCVAYDSNNDTIKEKHCLCPSNFTGDLCTEPRECETECFNGGNCIMEEAWYLHEPKFIEEIMEELVWSCSQNNIFEERPFNADDCMEQLGYGREYCRCPPNVWGSQCENVCDLDCSGSNGNCTFTRNDNKMCNCFPGFAGENCQYPCNVECENGGRCVSDGTTESCQCTPFWEGDRCQAQKTCSKDCPNGGTCVFVENYRYYEDYFLWCLHENNGDCEDLDQPLERCECPSGLFGPDCSETCPCQNGGTCSTWRRRELQISSTNSTAGDPYYDGGLFPDRPPIYGDNGEEQDNYYCSCPFGYYGNQCQYFQGATGCSIQCLNDGYCVKNGIVGNVNADGSYSNNTGTSLEGCVCPGNFTGPTCGEVLDECYNLCQNGVCSTSSTSTLRFGGGRALESLLRPEPEDPFDPAHDDFGPGHFGAFCACDDGYSGEYCERKACGSGYCANGAACIELPAGETTATGDDYVCDCTVASPGAAFDDVAFIGRQCDGLVRHECFNDQRNNPNENWQCANYGRCFYGSSGPQCRCDRGWEGPRCEANTTDTKDIAWSQCTLECQNDGACLKGVVKPIASMFTKFLEATKKSNLFDYAPTANFEYCYCPTGFFGVDCEMQYELCGNQEHICFHGSTCEETGGDWTCDCTGTESAGLYCQYQATDDCGDSDADTFCTNGSTCGADKKTCSCLEGWEGDKCEVEIKTAAIQGGNEKWSDANAIRSNLAILFCTIAGITLVMM